MFRSAIMSRVACDGEWTKRDQVEDDAKVQRFRVIARSYPLWGAV